MKLSITGVLALAAACLFATASQAQTRDPYYRLTTEYLGANSALDVHQLPDGTWFGSLAVNGTGNGQNWYFIPLGDNWFRMTNQWNGMTACLDVDGDGFTYMDHCGAQLGQRWRIQRNGNTVTITNGFLANTCLGVDMVSGIYVARATRCNNSAAQRWTFTSTGIFP